MPTDDIEIILYVHRASIDARIGFESSAVAYEKLTSRTFTLRDNDVVAVLDLNVLLGFLPLTTSL